MPVFAITLSDDLSKFVGNRLRDGGFASPDDYVSCLIQRVIEAERKFTALIEEGLESGPGAPFDRNFRKPE